MKIIDTVGFLATASVHWQDGAGDWMKK